jgi:hypothetical protein
MLKVNFVCNERMKKEDRSLGEDESSALAELEVLLEDSIDTLWKCAVLVDEFKHPDAMNMLKSHM